MQKGENGQEGESVSAYIICTYMYIVQLLSYCVHMYNMIPS